nr:hypothetical protein [uncultured Cellulosilyticum sp.]
MKKQNYEDLIMKRAMDLFAEEGLKYFGIEKKVKEIGPTELVVLETKNLHMDYTFLMEDDSYIHFEFQTTDKRALDLRRFRAYEALLSHQTNKDVETYVIYSNGITTPMSRLETGINTYVVKTVTLVGQDVNEIFDTIKDKLNKGIETTKQDVIALAFTPIMGGTMSKQEKILKAIKMTMTIDKEYRYDVQSILYAFANKFLEGKELEDIKEELKMTELGKSLIKEGIEEGKKKKAIETAKEAIKMGLEDEKIIKLTGLTTEELRILKEMA